MSITPAQCRMARGALSISAAELADRASIAVNTVRRFEKGLPCSTATVEILHDLLKLHGIVFRSDEQADWIGFKHVGLECVNRIKDDP